jgi:glycosyltransferase involved in cell wall biosynthesis
MKSIIPDIRSAMSYGAHAADDIIALAKGRFQHADLSIFHQFAPPPSGGGHQFLRALWRETEALGFRVENNSISHITRACLFNSFNFDERRLQRLHHDSVLYVHRVDGPIDVYRGWNDGVDQRIWQTNQKFADKTIFQSYYSLEKHIELGLEFKKPHVVINSVDPAIFHAKGREPFSLDRKIRIVAASWSDNPRKGAYVYAWLDEHLDWERFEFTFIGRSPIKFKNIRMITPVPPDKLADILRKHDIYITASQDDPCSNSLLEALTCGTPALYLRSGGHSEIVKNAGIGFDSVEDVPSKLEKIVAKYEAFQQLINLPTIRQVANQYLHILELI